MAVGSASIGLTAPTSIPPSLPDIVCISGTICDYILPPIVDDEHQIFTLMTTETLATDLPDFITFDQATNSYQLSPSLTGDNIGTTEIEIVLKDIMGAMNTNTFKVTVTEAPLVPESYFIPENPIASSDIEDSEQATEDNLTQKDSLTDPPNAEDEKKDEDSQHDDGDLPDYYSESNASSSDES
jgi:hypothetical protein